jgi:hypothetical protein
MNAIYLNCPCMPHGVPLVAIHSQVASQRTGVVDFHNTISIMWIWRCLDYRHRHRHLHLHLETQATRRYNRQRPLNPKEKRSAQLSQLLDTPITCASMARKQPSQRTHKLTGEDTRGPKCGDERSYAEPSKPRRATRWM